jgi:hypothetical protein
MFATDPFSEAVAVRVCRRCPVLGPCATETARDELGAVEFFGVRAGLTAEQRQLRASATEESYGDVRAGAGRR